MKEMPTQILPADEVWTYVPDSDEWVIEKKSGSIALSKKEATLNIISRLQQIKANILKEAVQQQDVVDFYLLSLLPADYLSKTAIGPEHLNGLTIYQGIIEALRDEYVRRGMDELKDEAETTKWSHGIPDEEMDERLQPYYKYHDSGWSDAKSGQYDSTCENCGERLYDDDSYFYNDSYYCADCASEAMYNDAKRYVKYDTQDRIFIAPKRFVDETGGYVGGWVIKSNEGHEEHSTVSFKEGQEIEEEREEHEKKQLQLPLVSSKKRPLSKKAYRGGPWWEAPTDFSGYSSADYYKVFEYAPWEEMYGGPAWAEIAKTINQMEHETNWQKIALLIDHFHDLGHNTGKLLDKFPEWSKWFKNLLDLKASKDAIRQLMPLASPEVRKLVQEYYSVQRGEDWRKPQYPTTDFSNSDLNTIKRDKNVPSETLFNVIKFLIIRNQGMGVADYINHPNFDAAYLPAIRQLIEQEDKKTNLVDWAIPEINDALRSKGLIKEELTKTEPFNVGDRVTNGAEEFTVDKIIDSKRVAVHDKDGVNFTIDKNILKKVSFTKINLQKLSKKDKIAYEGGYESQSDSIQWGMAPPGYMANEPWKGSTPETNPEPPTVICPRCKSSDLNKEGEKTTCNACGTNFVPKPDRGSDDPTVNDYSQNYEWGPTDLGRTHQHQPGDSFWQPWGTEDSEGVGSNVMMSSFSSFMQKTSALNKSAISKNYALYIGKALATRTYTRGEAEGILKEKFPDAYAKGNYAILEEKFDIRQANLNKKAERIELYSPKDQPINVLINPTENETKGLLNKSINKELRYIMTTEYLFIWDAYYGTHDWVWNQLLEDGYGIGEHPEVGFINNDQGVRSLVGSLKLSHCGPCSAIKADVLRMLSDLKYKYNSVSDDILCEMAKLSAEESNKEFADKLKSVYESLPKEHEAEANKLKNHHLALLDIQDKIDNGEMKADKSLSKKEAAKEVPTLSNKVVTDLIPMFVDKTEPADKKCATCKFRIEGEKATCAIMKGEINLEKGTCNYWAEGDASKEQNPSQMERKTAGYLEANLVNCSTCKHYENDFCSLWNGKVKDEQCCMAWEGETIKEGSLEKKANPYTRYWIAPDGKEFKVAGIHPTWVKNNYKTLEQYGFQTRGKEPYQLYDEMIKAGWIRVSNESRNPFAIQVPDLRNIPQFLDDFVARNFNPGDRIVIGTGKSGDWAVVTDPFPSIQKAVNKELMRTKQASLLDEVLNQETQNEIASKYGPQMLVALRFYNDAVRYGQSPDRALRYAVEEIRSMGKPIDEMSLSKVVNNYF